MGAAVIDNEKLLPDAVPVIREFLRSIYTKHSAAFVHVSQGLDENSRHVLSKHLQNSA